MALRYKLDRETAQELKTLRERLCDIVDHYYDFGPDKEFEQKIEQAAEMLDLSKPKRK